MKYLITCCAFILQFSLFAQTVKVSSGEIKRLENFKSKYVDSRNVDVWLPANYDKNERYAVLYMHDGQMLFDTTITWNKQEWGVDETLSKLISENKIRKCIVVGVWNSNKNRHIDYFPQKPFESLKKQDQERIYQAQRANNYSVFSDKVRSDAYLKFLVTELKPFIDKTFSTITDQQNTFVAGSSMGGLISMYAICEYPKIFGGAACLSTHWPGIFEMKDNPIPSAFYHYLKRNLPNTKTHKIYFDHGTETLDAMYPPLQEKVDKIMKKKGFNTNNWKTLRFEGENHSEIAWKKRFAIPMEFLLKK